MSLATTVPRKQAQRLARPATRYWKGKAPKGVTDVASDSDDEEDDEGQLEGGDVSMAGEQDIVEEDKEEPAPILAKQPGKAMNVALRDVNISQEGKVIVAGREESGRTAVEAEEGAFVLSVAILGCQLSGQNPRRNLMRTRHRQQYHRMLLLGQRRRCVIVYDY